MAYSRWSPARESVWPGSSLRILEGLALGMHTTGTKGAMLSVDRPLTHLIAKMAILNDPKFMVYTKGYHPDQLCLGHLVLGPYYHDPVDQISRRCQFPRLTYVNFLLVVDTKLD